MVDYVRYRCAGYIPIEHRFVVSGIKVFENKVAPFLSKAPFITPTDPYPSIVIFVTNFMRNARGQSLEEYQIKFCNDFRNL